MGRRPKKPSGCRPGSSYPSCLGGIADVAVQDLQLRAYLADRAVVFHHQLTEALGVIRQMQHLLDLVLRDMAQSLKHIAVIDRSIEAEHGDIVVSYIEGDFNVKLLDLTHKEDGYIELKSANPKAPNFRIDADDNFRVWGVVVFTIKKWK